MEEDLDRFPFQPEGPMKASFEMNPRKNSEKFLRRFRGLVKKCQELGDITGFPVFFMIEKPKERHIFCNDDNFWAEYTGNGIQENVAGKRYKVINNQAEVVSYSLKIRPADRKRENQFANSQTVGRVVENVAELRKESTWMIDANLSELMKCAAALQTPVNTIADTGPIHPIIIQPMSPAPQDTVAVADNLQTNQQKFNGVPTAASDAGEIASSLISDECFKLSASSRMAVSSSKVPGTSNVSNTISKVKNCIEDPVTAALAQAHNNLFAESTTRVDNVFPASSTSAMNNMPEFSRIKEEKMDEQKLDANTLGVLNGEQWDRDQINSPSAPALTRLVEAGIRGLLKKESDDGAMEDQGDDVCTPQNLSSINNSKEILNPIGSIVQNPKFATSTSLELCQKFLQGSLSPEEFQRQVDRVSHTLTDKSELMCHICSREFTRKDRLNTHMLTHTREKKSFECADCGKKFGQKLALTIHIRIHTGEKPYECSVCSKKFSQKSSLQTHMFSHTGEKPFQCNVCCKAFGKKDDLKKHMRTHTGEKPFECSECDKKFSQKVSLQTHMMMHMGDRPFECSICSKKFIKTNDLKKHMRTHTGEKPFSCSVCDAQFALKGNLTKHMKQHRESEPHEKT